MTEFERLDVGVKVVVLVVELYETLPGTATEPFLNVNVVESIVDEAMASLNVTVMGDVSGTLVPVGVTVVTVGRVLCRSSVLTRHWYPDPNRLSCLSSHPARPLCRKLFL